MQLTNATKAVIITAVNTLLAAIFAVLVAFHVAITSTQEKAVGGLISAILNIALLLWVALTYKNSPKRIPDA